MFRLNIKTNNDAFADDREAEIARILREAADMVEQGVPEGKLYDINGNGVGEFTIGRVR